ncbi:MAG TPA: FtsX-like permease family protein [Terriglobales bacterium]|nr:FtsX-like permease family protein [Terriglobales bacterium]
MTLFSFMRKNAFRNKRRSLLTLLSIGFSLLLLTVMMTIWHAFYNDQGSAESAERLIVRHKVSLAQFLPISYRESIRSIPGVRNVVNETWFGGQYKDDKPENFFAQFGTDPNEIFDVQRDFHIPPDQLDAWKHDRAGCVVDAQLAQKHGWQIGDRINIKGTIFPFDLELTLRGIFTAPQNTETLYFNNTYFDEGYPRVKGLVGFFGVLADSPGSVPIIAKTIDTQFRNSDWPTKSESEKAFNLDWIAMMGNVKAFILSICAAVVFATLLVSANTMAMSIRERTREVALLKTLGFTRATVLGLFMSESITLAALGGLLGALAASGLIFLIAHSSAAAFLFTNMKASLPTILAAVGVGAAVGVVSSFVPAYNASRRNIVEGLRHIG